MRKTKYGLEYDVVTKINENWNSYDKTVGQSQLNNYGKIFVDGYGCPIDNEYDLATLEEENVKGG